ncbi:hypothetical protein A8C56_10720 [Niabella ginsenosidivorans]|uniref:Uncharacterized protein n=1 Tax=Niabella ginsenosidivorans TaxID=1176587 RepID=A0A1A9I4A0_9BACT|nr:hypothetical protein A8C56_10720 [Niabella ginsenosidivorans]
MNLLVAVHSFNSPASGRDRAATFVLQAGLPAEVGMAGTLNVTRINCILGIDILGIEPKSL